ncbi:hypothetical protein [Pseudomarimonas arenosa]|uniref:DNA-binding protein n=1 Tax=Pseudomarimonas arenosa TaxID=2774145 RepID=A0AAW3ZIE0_9GAMM|nr:hypothetical protein [Pseudomarimonas arenosa]MBD8524710.1 hypothetical protein [Pseudomarimonas arenosa]
MVPLMFGSLFLALPSTLPAQQTVGAGGAAAVVGKGATVCGKVESYRYEENSDGQPTFLHFGGAYPNHTFAVRIAGDDTPKFQPAPEALVGQMICVTGTVAFAQGNKPEMVISSPTELTLM